MNSYVLFESEDAIKRYAPPPSVAIGRPRPGLDIVDPRKVSKINT